MEVKFFEAKLQKLLEQLEKRLKNYVDNPKDERNVHDVRTSLRRLDSMFQLFTKKIRKLNRKRIAEYRAFFKATSSMRDYDIIIGRLSLLSPDSRSLSATLRRKRDRELGRVVRRAKALLKIRSIAVKRMCSNELEARIDKVARKLCDRADVNMSLALANSSNVEQLHSLRKDLKKLRYILETLNDQATKTFEKMMQAAGIPADIELLEKLQDKLGDIHDSDITLEYLRSSRSEVSEELQAKEGRIRESLYQEFVKFMTSTLAAGGKEV